MILRNLPYLVVTKTIYCLPLHDQFLKEQKPGFIATLVRTRVLPLYKESLCQPYLIASANWVLGELSPCIPEVRQFPFHLSYNNCSHNYVFIYTSMDAFYHFNAILWSILWGMLNLNFQEMNADIYASLLKVLTMPDTDKFSCFPVRTSSAGAIAKLVEVRRF